MPIDGLAPAAAHSADKVRGAPSGGWGGPPHPPSRPAAPELAQSLLVSDPVFFLQTLAGRRVIFAVRIFVAKVACQILNRRVFASAIFAIIVHRILLADSVSAIFSSSGERCRRFCLFGEFVFRFQVPKKNLASTLHIPAVSLWVSPNCFLRDFTARLIPVFRDNLSRFLERWLLQPLFKTRCS